LQSVCALLLESRLASLSESRLALGKPSLALGKSLLTRSLMPESLLGLSEALLASLTLTEALLASLVLTEPLSLCESLGAETSRGGL